jgi:hypothetical protein
MYWTRLEFGCLFWGMSYGRARKPQNVFNDQIPHSIFDHLDHFNYNITTTVLMLHFGHQYSRVKMIVRVRSFLCGYLGQQVCCV